jgi:hypothetical protein
MNRRPSEYDLCFRPSREMIDSPNRYACKYLSVSLEEVRLASELEILPSLLTERFARELSALGQLI